MVVGRDDDHGHLRVLAAHMQQGRKAAGAGHAQVQQHQLDLGVLLQRLAQGGGAGGLQGAELGQAPLQHVQHGGAEQGWSSATRSVGSVMGSVCHGARGRGGAKGHHRPARRRAARIAA